ncbi:DEAD/DEAH box helicase family protein, partial [Planococcus sp. SIMBA_143]
MIDTFDYIVCDEAHYFISDSSFNPATELAFNFLNDNEEAVKIFMTGTPDGLYYLPWAQGLKMLKEADYYNNKVK